jgi:hypothetical protein
MEAARRDRFPGKALLSIPPPSIPREIHSTVKWSQRELWGRYGARRPLSQVLLLPTTFQVGIQRHLRGLLLLLGTTVGGIPPASFSRSCRHVLCPFLQGSHVFIRDPNRHPTAQRGIYNNKMLIFFLYLHDGNINL